MKNKLTDLNNHLFAQLERISDENISDEELDREIKRGRAIDGVAKNIINNASVQLQAARLMAAGDVGSNVNSIMGIQSGETS